MRVPVGRLMGAVVVAVATVAVAVVGTAGAQAPKANDTAKAQAKPEAGKASRKGGLRVGGGVPPKDVGGGAADPLEQRAEEEPKKKAAAKGAAPEWPFHVTFRLTGRNGQTLDAAFYPARGGADAPVLLLVHQTGPGHSSEDFQRPSESAEGQSLAERLQKEDYAVLLITQRGHGANVRKQEVSPRDPRAPFSDLHTAYQFLIDRHNRRELNLAKFGILAVGDGANLVAGWAAQDNGAVANPGRLSDLAALAMVSPVAEAQGVRLSPALATLAPRLPMLLITGARDTEFADTLGPILRRNPASSVKPLESRLQGSRLLEFDAEAVKTLIAFLEERVKFRRNAEWEPRYLLQPIAYGEIQFFESTKSDAKKVEAKPEAKKAEAKPEAKADQP